MRSNQRSHTSSSPKRRSGRFLRVALLGLAAITLMGGECDPKGPDFFCPFCDLNPFTGDIVGRVTVDGAPQSGVTVTVRRNGTIVGMRTTDANGEYEFLELDPGVHTVSISTISGADCPGEQTANVPLDDEIEVNFACTTAQAQTGTVTGQVTLDGSGTSGVSVTLRMGTTTIAMTTTDGSGNFQFTNVTTGTKTVEIAAPSGATCPTTTRDVTVAAGATATADFACTSQPQTGTVTGQVTVNGSGVSGVSVTLRMGTTTIATTTTDGSGNFQFMNVATGTKTVEITPPSGATCPTTTRDVTIAAGATATADFACTVATTFTVMLVNFSWEHTMPGVESVECGIIQTSPAQPNASWMANVTGPGVISGQTFGGSLNTNGQAELRARINQFGTYTNQVTVNSNGVQMTASGSVNVLSSNNTCPVLQSSARFKRSITPLLPSDVRVLGLRPVLFRYVRPYGDPETLRFGLIAEEVAEVFPQAVYRDGDGQVQGIFREAFHRRVMEEIAARMGRVVKTGIAAAAGAIVE
jgi:hypothetical protein